ncbi:MAG: CAP domain-containing protein [Sphingomicrobium sp.]
MAAYLKFASLAALSFIAAAPAVSQAPALDPLSIRLLAAQNAARASVGVPPLVWDPALAASAASYGPVLEALGRLQHSPNDTRPGQRENLWMGTRGAFSPEQMVSTWTAEGRFFRPGVFPNVSTTGNWLDVAHYTTLIWPTTTRVGCAIHRTPDWEFLICRYSPPGNIDGRPVP